MSAEDYPTPETDAQVEENRGALPKYGWVSPNTARSLESRLALARETLRRVQNTFMRDAQRNLLIDTALKETEPLLTE